MDNRGKKIIIPFVVFIVTFVTHLLYFRFTEGTCGTVYWFQRYITEKEYFLGISYALSLAFMAFAFLKYKENKRNVLKAAVGGGLLAAVLWLSCFFFGCCGSPMMIVYLNLFGLSALKIPKVILFVMTAIFIGIAYILLIKNPNCNCDIKAHKEDEKQKI